MRQPKIVIVGAGLVGGAAAMFAADAIPGAETVTVSLHWVRAESRAFNRAHTVRRRSTP
jgi:L-lactate dehydrogenase